MWREITTMENQTVSEHQFRSRFPALVEFVFNIVTAVVLFLVIYLFVAQPHQVEGDSMFPNYHSGDYVLTEKITEHFEGIQRGDVVVFRYPRNRAYDYIKRVVALPGDTVLIREGQVFVNNQSLEEPYLSRNKTSNSVLAHNSPNQAVRTDGRTFLSEGEEFEVPTDEMIVMGDNRPESSDSREWGTVALDEIIGKVFFRYWPPSRIGLVSGD